MSVVSKSVWYHCGHCGSLFQSDFGFDEHRLCQVCGRKPGLESRPGPKENSETDVAAELVRKGEAVLPDGRKAVRKKRRSNLAMKIVLIWTFLLLGVVALRYHLRGSGKDAADIEAAAERAKATLTEERRDILGHALPDCHRSLIGFLTANTPEARNQFVADPIETAGKMAVFHSNNPLPKVDVSKLTRTAQELIKVGERWMVATRWKESGEDGAEFDAVFRRQAGTWKLDWSHFSRYSEFPWTLFLAGEGPDEAEFRLLARQMFQDDEAERSGVRLSFVLLSPEWGDPKATGTESPDFVIDRRSDEGILLRAALEKKIAGESMFGGLPPIEPAGLIRVRVRVKREDIGGTRRFEIEELPACHWIDSDVRGLDLEELKDDLFGGI